MCELLTCSNCSIDLNDAVEGKLKARDVAPEDTVCPKCSDAGNHIVPTA